MVYTSLPNLDRPDKRPVVLLVTYPDKGTFESCPHCKNKFAMLANYLVTIVA